MDLATQKMFDAMAHDADKRADNKKRQQHIEEFKKLNTSELLKWDDSKLATWQSQYEKDEAQWIIAEHEWRRRAGISTRKIAILAITVSSLSLLVAALAFIHSLNPTSSIPEKPLGQPEKQSQPQTQSSPENHH
jgi:hypothetical protein